MNDIDPDFEVFAKCVDDQDPRLDYKFIRGYGGVCVFWRKSLNSSVKISSQGNDRTIIAEIATDKLELAKRLASRLNLTKQVVGPPPVVQETSIGAISVRKLNKDKSSHKLIF